MTSRANRDERDKPKKEKKDVKNARKSIRNRTRNIDKYLDEAHGGTPKKKQPEKKKPPM